MIIGLAPMDGYTDCAFRQITKEIFEKYGEKEKYEFYLRTEFMNADGYIINPLGVIKHLLTSKEQAPVIAQIFGGNEDMLMKCFSDIQKKYGKSGKLKVESGKLKKPKHTQSVFAGIELNMGCPARNVMNTGGGSALLKDRKTTLDIIKNLSGVMKIPLSIKTRTGIDEKDMKEQMDFLVEASKYVTMITIHGRTVRQGYSDQADWSFIYELKKQIEGKRSKVQGPRSSYQIQECKLIGNGGIKSYSEIHSHCEGNEAILDGVLIGEAAIGNPRIFTPHTPSRAEIKETILKHLNYMITYENYFQGQKKTYKDSLVMPGKLAMNVKKPQAIMLAEFRKHLFQYVKGIPGSKEFKQKVSTIVDYKQLVEEIQKFFA